MSHLKLSVRILLCVGVFAIVMECCARVDDKITYGAPLLGAYNEDSLYRYDELGKWGQPYARYKKWALNSLGYRGPELQEGTTRIVCFGASETFGLYEAEGEEYPRQLERELRQEGMWDIQVVNAAYPGETIVTASKRLLQLEQSVHPQFAVIYPSVASYIYLPWIERTKNQFVVRTLEGKNTQRFQWRIADNIHNLFKTLLPEKLQTKLRHREVEAESQAYTVMDFVPDRNIQEFQADLTNFVATLRLEGTEPILVTHATRFGPKLSEQDRGLLIAWRKFFPMLKEDGFLDMELRMNGAIRKVATEQNVMLVDAASEMPRGSRYFADAVHFTTLGAGVMARLISGKLAPVLDEQNAVAVNGNNRRTGELLQLVSHGSEAFDPVIVKH